MKKDGGPAFPTDLYETKDGRAFNSPGISIRDYFAAKAMQAHLSNSKTTEHPAFDREGLVKEAYELADAMIAEREK